MSLPNSWVVTPLSNLLDQIVGGGTPSKAIAANFIGTVPFMTVKDMKARFISDTADHISEEAVASSATTKIPADTLVVATRMSLGKIVRPSVEVAINQDLKALFPSAGINKTYIEYFWRSKSDFIQSKGTGTTVKGIRIEDIKNLEVPLAPENEQRRIADKLDTTLARVDALNDRLARITPLLKRFRQSVLAAATSGRLTEDWRASNLKVDAKNYKSIEVPNPYSHLVFGAASWKSLRFDEAINLIGGSQPPKSVFSDVDKPGYIRLIQIRDYKSDKHITFIPRELARKFCSKTDVMIGRYGPPIFQILRGLNGAYNVALMKAVPVGDILINDYLYYFLQNFNLLKYVEAGSDRTAGQDGVNKDHLNKYPVFVPSIQEQTEIVRRVETLFAFANRLEARLQSAQTAAERLTPALLAKAFRGELVPQDPNDEPAVELLRRLREARAADTASKPKRGRAAKAPTVSE